MNKNIVIIGNGFDLAVGLPTSYAQFVNNKKYWPIILENAMNHAEDSLYNYILKFTEANKDTLGKVKWVDLEELLLRYALSKKDNSIFWLSKNSILKDDIETYELIKQKFLAYLIEEVNPLIGEVNSRQAVVKKVFKAIFDSCMFQTVYSFNYTPSKDILKETFNIDVEVKHIHGFARSYSNSIILGINDTIDIPEEYYFLQKTMDPAFKSHSLADDLMDADEIVLFGLSLGEADLMYFGEFFATLVKNYIPGKTKKKHIYIFTYDRNSKASILKNIKKYAQVSGGSLFSAIDLNIYSQEPDWELPCNGEFLYEKFFQHMQEITRIPMDISVHTIPLKSKLSW